MMLAIHQPEFMPWLGFFNKMKMADKYIVFDHVQFKKRYFENRNKIKFNEKSIWLTLPVKSRSRFTQAIKDVEIDASVPWQRKMSEKIRHCYSRSSFFNDYYQEVVNIIHAEGYKRLIDFNMAFIEFFRHVFVISTPMEFSSDLNVESFQGSDLILEICKKTGATKYLCGISGKDYLKLEEFQKSGIEIIWQDFRHPEYPQEGKPFIPSLSALDLVFCCGSGQNPYI